MSHHRKSHQSDKVCFRLNCPNDLKKLCDLSSAICPPIPQPAPVRSGGAVLDFGGTLSNVSATNFNLLVPWQHGSAVQAIVVPNVNSSAIGVDFLVPGIAGTRKIIQGLRVLPQPSLVGISFILRVNTVPTNLRVSTSNPVSNGTVEVVPGDLISVVADLSGIPTSSVLGFATVTAELI